MTQREISTVTDFSNAFGLNVLEYKEVFQKIGMGILLIKAGTGQILDANEILLNSLACTIDDLLFKPFDTVEAFRTVQPMDTSIQASNLEEFEAVIWNKSGDPINVGIIKTYLHAEQLLVLQFINRDLQQKKETESKWQQEYERMENLLHQRTAELEKALEALKHESFERQQLTKNIHDSINQSLFSATLIAEVLPRLWERDQQAARNSLEDLHRLTLGASAEVKILFAESKPSVLRETEFGHILSLLGNILASRLNIPVSVQLIGKYYIDPGLKISLYYLCKETLFTLIRQVKPARVEIQLVDGEKTGLLRIGLSPGANQKLSLNSTTKKLLHAFAKQVNSIGAEAVFKNIENKALEIAISWNNPV